MNQSVHLKRPVMKLFIKGIIAMMLLIPSLAKAQAAPELVFMNPVLKSGTAKKEGAIYRFSNVTPGVDAEVKLKKFSSNDIVMNTIDNSSFGWSKAFQPEFGLPGIVKPWQSWYIDFEMVFYESGKTKTVKMSKVDLTALDVDGDNWSISEYVTYERPKSISYSQVSYLVNNGISLLGVSLPCALDNISSQLVECSNCKGDGMNDTDECQNCEGSGYLHDQCDHAFKGIVGTAVNGPIQNFLNIDTAATQVMATYHYEDIDKLKFRYGARSGAFSSNGSGIRLNSTWFRQFSLAPVGTLPVTFHKFTTTLEKKNVTLNWSIDTDDNFSHYVVERSNDGKNFKDIGIVFTSGLVTPGEISHYKYKDMNVASSNGIVYYRLRWEEQNKETYYSPVRIVRLGSELQTNEMITYPNPVRDQLKITVPTNWQDKTVKLELYASNGTMVYAVKLNSASQTEVVSLGNLPRGFYLIRAKCENQSSEQRIIKD
jgi:hypothetical protein